MENKGYLNLWTVGRGFGGDCISWVKVLGMLYFTEKQFQVIAGHELIKGKGNLTWALALRLPLMGERCGHMSICNGTYRPMTGSKEILLLPVSGVWRHLNPILVPHLFPMAPWLPQPHINPALLGYHKIHLMRSFVHFYRVNIH